MNPAFGLVDWAVILVYMGIVLLIGTYLSKQQKDTRYFFLAGRTMPAWAVSLSVVATGLSAATYIGVPQIAFDGNLTYLMTNVGVVIAAFIIALYFVPPIYQTGSVTIYGYLGKRYGVSAKCAAGVMFLFGRLLSSGARLFMAGIAFSLMLYGDTQARELVVAVILLGVVGTLYTVCGGIRAVIWTDVIQFFVMLFAAVFAVVLLLSMIPASPGAIIDALRHAEGGNKLQLLDSEWNISNPFTVWAGVFAMIVVGVSTHGVDHDMAQRVMTARSPWHGGVALVSSVLIVVPVVAVFLAIGLLLFVFYQRPDIMGASAPWDTVADTRRVFPQFVLNHMPVGAKGLTMAGLMAAAMSTFDSAINSMAACLIADVYAPWRRRRLGKAGIVEDGQLPDLRESRLAVALMGGLLTLFAIGAIYLQERGGDTLINFALGVMAFALAPLLGVFCAALFTRRGNSASALAALVVGVVGVLLLQPYFVAGWMGWQIGWPWVWVAVSPISFCVCCAGRPGLGSHDAEDGN